MIPLKLEIENFLAYRSLEPVDLKGLHLACLAGANGAGKSSLLDAMTWALWGKARTRRDDDLIHGDEEEMQVRLTFDLDGNCYRVLRYRTRRGRGSSDLHFEIQDGDGWRTLSEPTIRETQKRIIDVLRLDYDTFINSAFLMQGRADEFTQKTPGERKAILSDILGLDVWAQYEERAKEQLRAIEREQVQIKGMLDNIAADLAREAEYQQELEEAENKRDRLEEEVHEAQMHYNELESARRELEQIAARYGELEQTINRDRADLRQLEIEQEEAREKLAEHSVILSQRAEIEAGIEALVEARQIDQDFSERLMAQGSLREQLNTYEREIASEHSRLQAEMRAAHARRAKLTDLIGENGTKQRALDDALSQRLPELEERSLEREEWSAKLSDLRSEHAEIQGINRSLKAEVETLHQQREQIEAAQDAVCPLCEQELSDSHRADLLDRLAAEGGSKADEYRANRERLRELEAAISDLNREINQADGELRELPPLRQHIARLEEQIRQADEAKQELGDVEARMSELETALAEETYAEDARAGWAELQAQLAELGYDEAAHQEARRRIKDLTPFESRKSKLDYALKNAPETESHLARLDERAAAYAERIEEAEARLDEMRLDYDEVNERVSALQEWEHRLQDLRDAYGQAHSLVGAAQQKVRALDQQRERRDELTQKDNKLADRHAVYEQLREAFGKDGIPAMIIEATIPEIEAEANKLLARMTDGRMHVSFDTQREKVTGGTKETLDIRIADELGMRDYDTFSGGEAFRVNFAIRLALSRLLARRAGAQLRTLIMDEGFGTQDAQGRERLVQAINTIKDDFDLILVITHIDELKDAFPVRIEVTKLRDGSVVEIV